MGYSLSATALTFSKVYAFGDSLTDGGLSTTAVQSYAKLNGYTNTCGYESRLTNGQTTIEQAAARVSLYSKATFENYAISGHDSYSTVNQVKVMLKRRGGRADAKGLFVIFMGANDMSPLMLDDGKRVTSADDPVVDAKIAEALGNMNDAVRLLVSKGARRILFLNLPNFRYVPEIKTAGVQDLSEAVIQKFNMRLAAQVDTWNTFIKARSSKASVKLFDIFALSDVLFSVAFDSVNAVDSTHPLFDENEYVAIRCDELVSQGLLPTYNWPIFDKNVFYDSRHFSRRVHSFFGYQLGDFLMDSYQ